MKKFAMSLILSLISKSKLLYQERALSRIIHEFGEPIIYYDIGARFGCNDLLRNLAKKGYVKVFAFEPDEIECDRLNKIQKEITFLPYALGSRRETKQFFITEHPGCSSFLRPNLSVLQKYPVRRCFEISKIIDLDVETIDYLVETKKILPPHLIKTDTQGFELEILKGAKHTLPHVYGIQLESHFEPIYEGQALFKEIHEFLNSEGLDLVSIHSHGPFEGKVVELECFFFRNSISKKNKMLRLFFEKISGDSFIQTMADAVLADMEWRNYDQYVSLEEIQIAREVQKIYFG